ncbi:hypothetical protein EPN52_13715 [bacterium]|nr:MAG: hypothetical protein EPN52_13715 [bacterium]
MWRRRARANQTSRASSSRTLLTYPNGAKKISRIHN